MPRATGYYEQHEHRNKYVQMHPACIARPVKSKEVKSSPKAQEALDNEWTKLETLRWPDKKGHGTWDISKVAEWSDVKRRAQAAGEDAHVGRVAELCFEKGSELKPDDARRIMKGRAVFPGDQVKDQDGKWAIYAELGSALQPWRQQER